MNNIKCFYGTSPRSLLRGSLLNRLGFKNAEKVYDTAGSNAPPKESLQSQTPVMLSRHGPLTLPCVVVLRVEIPVNFTATEANLHPMCRTEPFVHDSRIGRSVVIPRAG